MTREGATMAKVPTFEQVFPKYVPRDWWGPEFRGVIEDAITAYEESLAYGGPDDPSDFAHEFADGWPSVYTAEIMEAYQALRLWGVDSVASEVAEYGGFGDDMVRGATLHLYALARMAMDAVLRAANETEEEEE